MCVTENSTDDVEAVSEESESVVSQRKRKRDTYVKLLTESLRATYGTSSGKPAQQRAMRDAANAMMDEDNIHHHQRNGILARVLAMVTIPSDDDVLSHELMNCYAARRRKAYQQPY